MRHAVYYIPKDETSLAQAGFALLGRSPRSGEPMRKPGLSLLSGIDLTQKTKKASIYGFHATIVAPFYATSDEREVKDTLKDLLKGEKEIKMPPLRIETPRDNFVALVPERTPEDLKDLESKLVRGLNHLMRTDLPQKDRGPLNPRMEENYRLWGYPFVLDEFDFHLTIADETDERILSALKSYFPKDALAPFTIDSLCLTRQLGDGPFEVVVEFPLERGHLT
jgi:hypothetical protein